MKAIWFSRHQPSREQIEDAASMGYTLVAVKEGIDLGGVNINNEETLVMVMDRIKGLLCSEGAEAIFGVFPVPVLNYMCQTDDGSIVSCYSSWNVSRTPEGGKPTFAHKEWCIVGFMRI